MSLLLFHPSVAATDCKHCLKYEHNPLTGKTSKWRGGDLERSGTSKPLCRLGRCPKGSPENPKELSLRNAKAYLHYQECRAVGKFPDDSIVKRNASIIRSVEESKEDQHKQLMQQSMMAICRMTNRA